MASSFQIKLVPSPVENGDDIEHAIKAITRAEQWPSAANVYQHYQSS
jgi:hypothetical protein